MFKKVAVRSQTCSGNLVLDSLPVPFEKIEAYAEQHPRSCVEVVLNGRHEEVPLHDLIFDEQYRHPAHIDLYASS